MALIALIFILIGIQSQEALVVLKPGDIAQGVIEEGDPVVLVHPLYESYTPYPTLGKQYGLSLSEAGSYTIDLKSLTFDAYLVLRDEAGEKLAEDDNGLYGTHSRIVYVLSEGNRSLVLQVCALYGERGAYTLELIKGKAKELTASEKSANALEDAREKVRLLESREEPKSPNLARALGDLAALLGIKGDYEEARPLHRRSIEIFREIRGLDHLETAISIHRLGTTLQREGRYAEAILHYEQALGIKEKVLEPDHLEIATSLHGLAGAHSAQGHYKKAQALCERALSIDEKVLGPEHLGNAQILNDLGYYHHKQGDYEGARSFYEKALHIREKVLGSEDPKTALSLNNIAFLLYDQGNYEEAKPLFERAIGIQEKQYGPDHPLTALMLNNLALLVEIQGNYQEARAIYERTLPIYEKHRGPEHPDTSKCLNNLGSILKKMGNYEEARPLLERGLQIREKVLGPDHISTSTSLNNLALLLFEQGNYEQAKPLFERALLIRERTLGKKHLSTAKSYNNLALLLLGQGSFEQALKLYEHALSIREKKLGAEHAQTAFTRTGMAYALDGQNRFEEAEEIYEGLLGVYEKIWGPEHPNRAIILNNLAVNLKKQGKYERAGALAHRALAIREKHLGPDHPKTATNLNNLASLLQISGHFEQARTYYLRALEIHEKLFPPNHPLTTLARSNLVGLLRNLGELEAAWELSEQTVYYSEKNLDQLLWSLSEDERLKYLALNKFNIDMRLTLARERQEENTDRIAYEAMLRWKGRISRSLYQSKNRLIRDLTEEAKTVLLQLEETQSLLSKALYAQSKDGDERSGSNLSLVREKRVALENKLARLAGRPEEVEGISLFDLQESLPENGAILDFYIHKLYEPLVYEGDELISGNRWSPPHLSAWIVHKGDNQPITIDFGPAEPLRKAVETFLESLVRFRGGMPERQGTEGPTPEEERNQGLRTVLWDPVERHLKEAKTIFISSDGFLGTFPFEALQLEDGSYLIEHSAIVYLQDMNALVRLSKENRETGRIAAPKPGLLVVGNVDYKRAGDLTWQKQEEGIQPDPRPDTENRYSPLVDRGGFSSYWGPLSQTRYEAETMADLFEESFGGDHPFLLLQGREAIEERLMAELPRYEMVHIATHGFFQPEGIPSMWEQAMNEAGKMEMIMDSEMRRLTGTLPGFLSGLVLAGANTPPEEGRDDGYLTAEELTWLDLSKVDLVVLSACETGLGSPRGGEGMIGLRRSLRQAGVKTVISSLWSVQDESTRELMQNFYYRLWLFKESKLEALRGAQLDMLKQNRIDYGHGMPSNWGAFVLDGQWK